MDIKSALPLTPASTGASVPLCVDLDGTLIHSDLLIESALTLLKKSLLYLFLLPLWLLNGKANLKTQIARRVTLDVVDLPYNRTLLAFLRQERTAGRHLVLTTAVHSNDAQRIADYLGLFDEILPTNDRNQLQQHFGAGGFTSITEVNPDLMLPAPGWRDYGRLLRLHQWLKNSLVFVPLVAAHWITHIPSLLQAGVAFLAFSLCASSVYLLNDLLDLAADRQHPHKRQRPLVAGIIPLQHGLLLIPLLLSAAAGVALWLPWTFLLILAGYYSLALAYTLGLKQIASIDVITLALLYTARIIAGIAAIGSTLSPWLLGFSLFIFLSLALVKRCAELQLMLAHGRNSAVGRGYQVDDLPLLHMFGASSGYMAVLVLALYISSPDVRELYTYPQGLWLLCPVMLYWITRIWLKTHRGEMHDDPVMFAVTDRISQLLGLLILATLLVAA